MKSNRFISTGNKKMIDIRCSWGDDEKPVEVPDGEDAWQFMLELVVKEAKIECQDYCDEGELKIIPKEDSLELHYMDGEICYYTII